MDEAREPTPHALTRFSDEVRGWFLDAFPEPTPLQECAWDVIEGGENALVIAPTGSGKTLAAFLFAIDELMREKAATAGLPKKERPGRRARAAISPLKVGWELAARCRHRGAHGGRWRELSGRARTGDTTPDQRRSLQRNPPDTYHARTRTMRRRVSARRGNRHRRRSARVGGNKRGAHLALSLSVSTTCWKPASDGLSAVRPRDEIARFLAAPSVTFARVLTWTCDALVRDMTPCRVRVSDLIRKARGSAPRSESEVRPRCAPWRSPRSRRARRVPTAVSARLPSGLTSKPPSSTRCWRTAPPSCS
ncbi:MAG: DEAD/DEAH box helicase [Eggerthella lenta]